MAVLNPPSFVPELGFVAYRQLVRHEGVLDWVDLHRRISPTSACNSIDDDPAIRGQASDPLNVTLRSLRDIGVLDLSDGEVRLVQHHPVSSGPLTEEREEYRRLLTSGLMLSVDLSTRWDDGAEVRLPGSTDLARSLAWWVLQPPNRLAYWPKRNTPKVITKSGFDVEKAKLNQLEDSSLDGQVIHNAERWQSFMRWSIYLGFAVHATPPKGAKAKAQYIYSNPEDAIRRAIRGMDQESRRFEDFYADLIELLPILPGGSISQSIQPHFDAQISPGTRDLPPAISVALLQLEENGILAFRQEPDAEHPWTLRLPPERQEIDSGQEIMVSDVTITL